MTGIDPDHIAILYALKRAGEHPLKTADVHRCAGFGPRISIEGVGRRLKTLQTHGRVRRADYDANAAWRLTNAGVQFLDGLGS